MSRYATTDDLHSLALPAHALESISLVEQQKALDAASDEADGYLQSAYRLPLVSWGIDLTQHVCAIAAFRILSHRGYNPETGGNPSVRIAFEDALGHEGFLPRISAGRIRPQYGETSPTVTSMPLVSSRRPRGW